MPSPEPTPSAPSRQRRGGLRASLGPLLALALVVVVSACGAAKSKDATGAGLGGVGDTVAASDSSTTASTSPASPSSDDPAFAHGLAALWTDSKHTTVVVLPAGLAPCVQDKLSAADIAVVTAVKSPSDGDQLQDAVAIRLFRASDSCDHAGLVHAFSGELPLSDLGLSPSPNQSTCVASELIAKVSALDEAATSTSGGEAIKGPFTVALQDCVPIRDFLIAALSKSGKNSPNAVVCMADKAAQSLTWADVMAESPKVNTVMSAAGQACSATASGGGAPSVGVPA